MTELTDWQTDNAGKWTDTTHEKPAKKEWQLYTRFQHKLGRIVPQKHDTT